MAVPYKSLPPPSAKLPLKSLFKTSSSPLPSARIAPPHTAWLKLKLTVWKVTLPSAMKAPPPEAAEPPVMFTPSMCTVPPPMCRTRRSACPSMATIPGLSARILMS